MQIAWYDIDESLDHMFYAIEGIISAVLLTNIFQFGWWRCKQRKGSLTHWQRWDAAYFLAAALPLTMSYHMAIILIYIGHVNYPDSKMWTGGWFPGSPHGILLYIMKWIGTASLTVGVFRVTQLHRKIAEKWRELRELPQKE